MIVARIPVRHQIDPQLPVLVALIGHPFVEASDRAHRGRPHQRSGADRALAEQRREVAALLLPGPLLLAEVLEPARRERGIRSVVQDPDRSFEVRRMQLIVRVQCTDILATGHTDAEVARARQATVLRRHDARLRPDVICEEILGRGIGGAVVDDDNLDVPERLPEHAADCLVHVLPEIEARDDDGDSRRTCWKHRALEFGSRHRSNSASGAVAGPDSSRPWTTVQRCGAFSTVSSLPCPRTTNGDMEVR